MDYLIEAQNFSPEICPMSGCCYGGGTLCVGYCEILCNDKCTARCGANSCGPSGRGVPYSVLI